MTPWFVWMKILSLFMTSYCSLNSTVKNPSLGVSGLSNEYYSVVPMFSLMFTIVLFPPPSSQDGSSSLTSSSFSRLVHTELISPPEISLESRHFRPAEPHLMQEAPALPPLWPRAPTAPVTTSSPPVSSSPPTRGWAWLEGLEVSRASTTGTTTSTTRGSSISWAASRGTSGAVRTTTAAAGRGRSGSEGSSETDEILLAGTPSKVITTNNSTNTRRGRHNNPHQQQ